MSDFCVALYKYVSLKREPECRDNRNTELTAVTMPSSSDSVPTNSQSVHRRDRRRRNGYCMALASGSGLADLRAARNAVVVVALVRNAIPEELGRFNSFHYIRGISIFGHENSVVQHILAQSQVDFTMGGQKKAINRACRTVPDHSFPTFFPFLSCPPLPDP